MTDQRQLAETYHRVSELQLERGKQLVEQLGVGAADSVLDVGCGTGRLTKWLATRAGRVVGIDPLAERVDVARSTNGTSARFEVGRAEDLSAFADESFDVVCMSSVLHWVDDKVQALAEARRVLRPRGRLGITTVPSELAGEGTIRRTLLAVLGDRVPAERLTLAQPGPTTTELLQLLLTAGFEPEALLVAPDLYAFASGEAVVSFMEASAFGTLLRPVADALRAQLRAELVAAFDAHCLVRSWGATLVASRAQRPG